MALGDMVTVIIDIGAGKTREEVVTATSAGGKVAIRFLEDVWMIEERTRNGTPKRTIRVAGNRLVAVIDKPAR